MKDEDKGVFADFTCWVVQTVHDPRSAGRIIKGGKFYLENADNVSRKEYRTFAKKYSREIIERPYLKEGALALLDFKGVGYKAEAKRKADTEGGAIVKGEPMKTLTERQKAEVSWYMEQLDKEREYSPNTLRQYSDTLKDYFRYFDALTQENARSYIASITAKGRAPQTIRLRILGLTKYAEFKKKTIKLRRPKMKRTLHTENIPTEAEYRKLLDSLKGKRLGIFVKTLAVTGARISELMQFTWEDILKGDVVLSGKGNKYRQFFFTEDLQKEVREWLKEHPQTGLLLKNRWGEPMTSKGFSSILKDAGERAGIRKEVLHPHAFRHFFAKMYLKKSKDVIQLSEILGHNSLDTTRIYLQKSFDEQKKDFNRQVTW